jgi:O-antigen/teichoic acid export membrane protein
MLSFWKNASIMAIAETFLKLKALIMMPFITKYLGAMNYGIWSQVMVMGSLLTPLVFWGMDNSLIRYLPGISYDKQRQDFTGWLMFGIGVGMILLSIVYVFRDPFSQLFFGNASEYSLFVVMAGLNIVTTSVMTGIRNWFRVQNNAWVLVILTIAQNLLQMVVLIAVLINHSDIYALVLWSLILDGALIFISMVYMLAAKILVKPSFGWLKVYFRYGIALLPSGYAIWVLNSLDRVFLAQYHTLVDIGVYSICFTIGYTLIQVIVNPIWSLFPSKAAELYNQHKIDELAQIFNQSIKFICWIIFPSIFGLIVIGEPLLQLLTTGEFAAGYLVISIILLGYFCLMLSAYFETILALKNKPYLSTIFIVVACSLNVLLNYALIPPFSYLGAAVATTLSFGTQLTLSIIFARKEKLILLEYGPIIKILFASLIMFMLSALLKSSLAFMNPMSLILVIVTLAIAAYLFLTHANNIYNYKDLIVIFKGAHVNA